MRFRVKSSTAAKVVTVDGTLANLIGEIRKQDLIPADADVVSIKYGFPPKKVALEDKSKLLEEVGLKSGEQLIIESDKPSQPETEENSRKKAKTATTNSDIPSVYNSKFHYTILRNVPDDNSCMFNSIIYAMFAIRGEVVTEEVHKLRSIVSDAIGSDRELYSELVLGRTNDKYTQWILRQDSWGGAIELGILSGKLDINFYCLDVELGKFIKFESSKSNKFMVLVYSGIHYDVMGRNAKLTSSVQDKQYDKCIFEKDTEEGESFLEDCSKLCKLLQTKNYSTNTTTFRVRCLECYEVLVGEMGASNHANKTGHFKFGEVK